MLLKVWDQQAENHLDTSTDEETATSDTSSEDDKNSDSDED